MKRVLLQPAYVLHRRSYKESSFLVELFTPEYGSFSMIAKGVRNPRLPNQGLLQPFIPLLISFAGKGELMSLSHVEVHGQSVALQGNSLFAGFYLNELLMCLLQKWDAHPLLYQAYEKALRGLQAKTLEQKVLRSFEKIMLEELGYGVLPKATRSLQTMFEENTYYRFIPEQGFVSCESRDVASIHLSKNVFSGKSLLALAKEDWQDTQSLNDARRLMRLVLMPLLGTRPIHSRRLFMHMQEDKDETSTR
jgi:DNA repair protein RecO (recombination protein O)